MHPTSVLADIRNKHCETCHGLSISVSALRRHLVQKGKVILKKLEKLPEVRHTGRVIS